MSCRHHEGDAAADKIYIMLWDGNLYSCTGNMLMDPEIEDKDLDLKKAVKYEDNDDDEEQEEDAKAKKSRSRSNTPVEGRWAEKSSSAERTPSRSPTPMKEDQMDIDQQLENALSPKLIPSKPGSPAAVNVIRSPAAVMEPPPNPILQSLPPYLPP